MTNNNNGTRAVVAFIVVSAVALFLLAGSSMFGGSVVTTQEHQSHPDVERAQRRREEAFKKFVAGGVAIDSVAASDDAGGNTKIATKSSTDKSSATDNNAKAAAVARQQAAAEELQREREGAVPFSHRFRRKLRSPEPHIQTADHRVDAKWWNNETLRYIHPWFSKEPGPLVVKTLCEPYTWRPPLGGTNLTGCRRSRVGNLLAVRLPNIRSAEERAYITRSGDKVAERCVQMERRALKETLKFLAQDSRYDRLRNNLATAKQKYLKVNNAQQQEQQKRKRIIVTAVLLYKDHKLINIADLYGLFGSFMRVGRPSTDELHVISDDFRGPEWHKHIIRLRNDEQLRRTSRKKKANLATDVADDGFAVPKIIVVNASSATAAWRWKERPPATEPPLNSRVWFMDRYVNTVLANESDATIEAMHFVDARDVLFEGNPFDAIRDLNLNGGGPAAAAAAATTAPSSAGQQFRGIFAAAEETNLMRRNRVFHDYGSFTMIVNQVWAHDIMGAAAFEMAFSWPFGNSTAPFRRSSREPPSWRRFPDLTPLPVLCSGYYGGSFSAVRDFHRLFLMVMQTDTTHRGGVDQGALNIIAYLGISAAEFPHPFFALDPGHLGPIKHFHFFEEDQYIYSQKNPGKFVNCANKTLQVLHQLDRKTPMWISWHVRNKELLTLPPTPAPPTTTTTTGPPRPLGDGDGFE